MAVQLPALPATCSSVHKYDRKAIQATTTNLLSRFEGVQGVYETSEAERAEYIHHDESYQSSTLCNSEGSPYGCKETLETLGQKLWGYQLASMSDLQELVMQQLPLVLRRRAINFLDWDDTDNLFYQLGEYGLFTKDMLAIFRALGVHTLDLTKTLGSDPLNPQNGQASPLLRVLQMPHSFRHLSGLILRSIPLQDEDLTRLSGLRSLSKLDLASTGISSEGTAHLVALKRTLTYLDLSMNPKIRHESAYNLAYLRCLETLLLDGTAVKMISLRHICQKIGIDAELYITVPEECKGYLLSLGKRYVYWIPDQYETRHSTRHLRRLSSEALRANLTLHKTRDSSISLDGGPKLLALTLQKVLRRRETDMRLRRWLTPKEKAVP